MPLISFIIPFFGSVPLLKRCLDSIAAQTDGDWEVIVVDDACPREVCGRGVPAASDRMDIPSHDAAGTPRLQTGGTPRLQTGGTPHLQTGGTPRLQTGGTPRLQTGGTPRLQTTAEIVAQYDARFRYVLQPENRGPYQGRVRGVEEARGEYVVDIDCDDYVMPELVAELRKAIERNQADIVIYNVEQDAQGVVAPHWCRYEPGVYTPVEVMGRLVAKKLQWNFWSKAIRREVILKTWEVIPRLRTTRVLAPDDFCATVPMILASAKIEVIPYVGHRYWQGSGSICRGISFAKILKALRDTREARRLVLDFADRTGQPPTVRAQIKAIARMISSWWCGEFARALKHRLRPAWLAVALGFLSVPAEAAEIREMTLASDTLRCEFPITIVLPHGYEQSTNRYPVVYLLHCLGGSNRTFVLGDYKPIARQAADEFQVILVMPDGRADCWWIDSPVVRRSRFEWLVPNEIVPFVDKRLRTRAERGGRAIAGVSMGGFGAWWIGLRHKDVFGSVGSILGCVEIWMAPDQKAAERLLGPKSGNEARWKEYSILEAAKTLKNGELDLISVNGTHDIFIGGNRQLHLMLSERGVSHAYIELCGENEAYSSHTGAFGSRALRMMLYSMGRFFLTGKGTL